MPDHAAHKLFRLPCIKDPHGFLDLTANVRTPPSSEQKELRVAIVIWIEKTYHRTRRQRGLGRLTPIEYETLNAAALAA